MEIAKLERARGSGKVDWIIRERLLTMGSILIVLGLILYFARGEEAVLALVAVGIVLLIAGVFWKPRKKKTGNIRRAHETEKENEKTESET
jgi:hypothetical protein